MANNNTPQHQVSPDNPLGDLDINQYTYSNFIYPLDVGSPAAGKDHYMVFHINESSNTQFFTDTVNGKAPTDLATINQNALNDTQGTSPDSSGGGTADQPTFGNQTRPINRVATTIVLYMPPEVTTTYAADWSSTELGVASEIADKFKAERSWGDLFKSGGASGVKHLGDWANQWTGLNLKDATSLGKRMVINNHLEVIFNGISFRQFNFNFRFTPESEAEALNVDNIIRAFKFYSAPEILQGWAGRFWIYPAEFDIQYYSNGVENEFLNKISTCALTNMQVNYTASGHWAAHRAHKDLKGSPSVCTDIALTFIELELMTKKRILEGYSFVPPFLFVPFLEPVINQLHHFFGFFTGHQPMPVYIEVWSIIAILSLMGLTVKRMLDSLLIQHNVGGSTVERLQTGKVMRYMKQFGNTVLKILHLK
jgi:hypothetical protein